MPPHGESFRPAELGVEPSEVRQTKRPDEPSLKGKDIDAIFARHGEAKRRREEDARQLVDIAIRTSGGNLDAVRTHIENRLRESRQKIDKLEKYDRLSQEEQEFLKSQHEAIKARVRAAANASELPAISPQDLIPHSALPPREPKAPSLMDRMRSGWSSLKARIFGSEAPAAPDYKGQVTAYEKAWTPEQKAERGPAAERRRNMEALQEQSIEKNYRQEAELQSRLNAVNGILTRRHEKPVPKSVLDRYAAEKKSLEEKLRTVGSELNIAITMRERRMRREPNQREEEPRKAA